MRNGFTLFFTVCLLSPAQQMPTFRATTTVVELNIVALNSAGKPVTDLKPEEIVILEDGQPRHVAGLRFEAGETAGNAPFSGSAEPLPPGLFSNRPELT